jgi:hypothetical protein
VAIIYIDRIRKPFISGTYNDQDFSIFGPSFQYEPSLKLTFQWLEVSLHTATVFNFDKFNIMSTEYMYVLCMDLLTNTTFAPYNNDQFLQQRFRLFTARYELAFE